MPSFDTEVLADAPYAYWKTTGLTAGASVAPDLSGHGNDANFQDPAAGWAIGGAAIFPGVPESLTWAGASGKYLYFNAGTLSSFSIEVLMEPGSLGHAGVWDQNGAGRFFNVSASGVLSFKPDGNTYASAAGAIAAGVAQHVVASYDTTTGAYAAWVNGVSVLSGTGTPGASGNSYMRFPWYLTDGNEMAGLFAAWAIYPTALSSGRVAAHYAAVQVAPGLDVTAPPLLARPRLLAGALSFPPPLLMAAPPMLGRPRVLAGVMGFPAPIALSAPPMLARPRLLPATVLVPVRAPIAPMLIDPSQGWGFNLGIGIDVETRDAAVVSGSRIRRRSETYPTPTLEDGRPT